MAGDIVASAFGDAGQIYAYDVVAFISTGLNMNQGHLIGLDSDPQFISCRPHGGDNIKALPSLERDPLMIWKVKSQLPLATYATISLHTSPAFPLC